MSQYYYVYIMGNSKPVLYIGVTSNLIKRIYEHKNKLVQGFTNQYNVNKLLYYEVFQNPNDAINREKQLKRWHREWKLNLIYKQNPNLNDLYKELI
ncbi:hypothetical protein A3D77_04645 [Candidatus Gottesmanbacteria bacterium RIFCSPHIGHO2_02_FULL_39_11]|uniref:GIY-YIG domain-containing protein n=1 Tax=Candidatus Gottesmanbacteria bacterium RIFCSPHIGHO2_02_FULL_39_11 TaxID=1798382 RepID=A0A1F5ZJE0_9BACT|nr:MAG: hypothetical protein A3D77_04645 [Candidatus Gottesmanbacteria bacterium RIFCSPHIGHO2_02_FULL_39_11]